MTLAVVGYIAFAVILLVSVVLHEAGHYVAARKFGMKATEFFVGFGPKLWSFRRGETEYGVKAIPAGGYVRITGMTQLDEVAPADERRAFYRQPALRRAVVLSAGSVVHFLIAFVLFASVPMILGRAAASLTVDGISPCVASTLGEPCGSTSEPSPAAAAGLRKGDEIVSLNGARISSWPALVTVIRAAGGGTVDLVVRRNGREVTLTPRLVVQERRATADPARVERVPVLGAIPTIVMERSGPLAALGGASSDLGNAVVDSFQGLAAIPAAIPDLFQQTVGGQERSADGLIGLVGIARVGGDVLGAELPLAERVGQFGLLMASLNVFIGIFNLLPLLPLDGGHLAILAFEETRKRVYRLFGRTDPGRVDLAKLLPAAYLFLFLLMVLTLSLVAADITNPPSI